MLTNLRPRGVALGRHLRSHREQADIPNARSRSGGQALLEFALAVPLLLLIFAGAADFGRAFYNYVALENSVKEGALYGARYPLCDNASTLCPDPDNVLWRVNQEARTAANTALVTPQVNECRNAASGLAYLDPRDCVAGDTYVVGANLAFAPLTPILGNLIGSLTLRAESQAIVLNQAFDPTPGLAPTKLVLATTARNASELAAKCQQPDPTGSPNFYRSPCLDTVLNDGTLVQATFRPGDTITYKLIVRNNGGTTVTGVTMTDTFGWPGACPAKPTSMAVNAVYVCGSYQRTAPSVSGAGTSSDYENDLTVDGVEILPSIDAAIVTIERPPADIQTLKFVSVYKLGDDGDGNPSFGINDTLSVGRTAVTPAVVWYKVVVRNVGGQTATGLTISDTNGSFPVNADCPAKPTALAASAQWVCFYWKSFNSNQVFNNTVSAASPDSPPDGNDAHTATVTVAACTGTDKLVPMLIGEDKTSGLAAWTAAGFTGTYANINNGNVVTQSRQAYSCMTPSTPITVTKAVTP